MQNSTIAENKVMEQDMSTTYMGGGGVCLVSAGDNITFRNCTICAICSNL